MDGWIDGWMVGWMDRRMVRWMVEEVERPNTERLLLLCRDLQGNNLQWLPPNTPLPKKTNPHWTNKTTPLKEVLRDQNSFLSCPLGLIRLWKPVLVYQGMGASGLSCFFCMSRLILPIKTKCWRPWKCHWVDQQKEGILLPAREKNVRMPGLKISTHIKFMPIPKQKEKKLYIKTPLRFLKV